MARWDVYENVDPDSQDLIPYLVDVQHDIHWSLATRIVIPLTRASLRDEGGSTLCPTFVIDKEELLLSTPEMGSYESKDLGRKRYSLAEHQWDIVNAIGLLIGAS